MTWTTPRTDKRDPLELRGSFRDNKTELVGYSMCLLSQPLLCKFWRKSHRDVKVRPFPKSWRTEKQLLPDAQNHPKELKRDHTLTADKASFCVSHTVCTVKNKTKTIQYNRRRVSVPLVRTRRNCCVAGGTPHRMWHCRSCKYWDLHGVEVGICSPKKASCRTQHFQKRKYKHPW